MRGVGEGGAQAVLLRVVWDSDKGRGLVRVIGFERVVGRRRAGVAVGATTAVMLVLLPLPSPSPFSPAL